jgi:hypothetical protein
MPDLFGTKTNGHSYLEPIEDQFRWVVAVFSGSGATEVIKRANERGFKTYFPIRINKRGDYVPLWANYLFIEFQEGVSIELCRTTTRFIKLISARDDDGILYPIMVRRDGINESLRLMMQGQFDVRPQQRPFHCKGSMVRVREGSFVDRQVRLEIDVTPAMRGKVPVWIDGIRAVIEIHKLAL